MGYVPSLVGLNLVLLVSSTACLYLGSILVNIYLLPYLSLISSNFATVPYLILAIGGLLLPVSILGIVAAFSTSRPALISYAVLLGLIFCLELASIFTSMELRNNMMLPRFFQSRQKDVYEEMSHYWEDEDIKFKWDTLQRDFQCCGAFNKNAYADWEQRIRSSSTLRRGNNLQRTGVPDSCCIDEVEGCANSVDLTEQSLYDKIYMHGCFFIMQNRYDRDILPVLLAYIISSVVLALITMITLVLAAAFVAAITRNENKDRDGLGMYQMPGGHNSGTNRYADTTISKPYSDTLDSGIVNGSLRSLKSQYSQLQEQPIIKGENQRSSLYIEPSNEAGTVI